MHGILGSDAVSTLLAVAEEASITRAGERLFLTQQAVSAQIKRLESSVGRRLVERSRQGVRLTRDGEAMLAYAAQMAEIDRHVRDHFSRSSVSGSIRIGIVEGFASTGLPSVLAALQALQPDLDITVESATTDRLISRLENRRLDVVIGLQRRGQSRGERLLTDHLCWFGDAEVFDQTHRPLHLLLHPAPSFAREIVIETLTQAGRPFVIQYESNSREGLRAAAIAGLGITALFRSFEHEALPTEPLSLPELGVAELFMRVDRVDEEPVCSFAELIRSSAASILQRPRRPFAKPPAGTHSL